MLPRFLKRPVYQLIRQWTGLSVRSRQLTLQQAEQWAEWIKRYPAIYQGEEYAVVSHLPGDITMQVGIIDHIERHLRVEGEWDRPVGHVLKSFLKPGSTFLDVGANIGYFSLLASRLVGSTGKVVAVEPSQRAHRKLLANIRHSATDNILVLSVGAGAEFSTVRLTLANQNNIGGSTILPEDRGLPSEVIAVVPLQSLLVPLQIKPDLIKLDIEGFELFGLRGLEQCLISQPAVVCEVTAQFLHRHQQSVQALLQFMRDRGYTLWKLDAIRCGGVAPLSISADLEHADQFDALFTKINVPLPAGLFEVDNPQSS